MIKLFHVKKDSHMNFKVERYTQDNGEEAIVMDMANKFGRMVLNTLENGKCTERMERENSSI